MIFLKTVSSISISKGNTIKGAFHSIFIQSIFSRSVFSKNVFKKITVIHIVNNAFSFDDEIRFLFEKLILKKLELILIFVLF